MCARDRFALPVVVVQLEGEHTSIERQQMAGFARKDSLALRTLLIVLTERLAGAAGDASHR